jgi:hypothetical protein
MTAADTSASPAVAGVGGAPLLALPQTGVACWHSEVERVTTAKDEALAFARVLQHFFAQQALATWLGVNAATVARELARLRDVVQMELNFTGRPPAAAAEGGRAYLEARRDAQRSLAERASVAREALADLVAEWRQRETRAGIRCYALVPRGREHEFMARIGVTAGEQGIRVTGPWPAAEFLDPALTKLA